jgi:hypothetical protein
MGESCRMHDLNEKFKRRFSPKPEMKKPFGRLSMHGVVMAFS